MLKYQLQMQNSLNFSNYISDFLKNVQYCQEKDVILNIIAQTANITDSIIKLNIIINQLHLTELHDPTCIRFKYYLIYILDILNNSKASNDTLVTLKSQIKNFC